MFDIDEASHEKNDNNEIMMMIESTMICGNRLTEAERKLNSRERERKGKDMDRSVVKVLMQIRLWLEFLC